MAYLDLRWSRWRWTALEQLALAGVAVLQLQLEFAASGILSLALILNRDLTLVPWLDVAGLAD